MMSAILLILLAATQLQAVNEAGFPRHPSLSPDGSEFAFSYAGDIWTVPFAGGTATRLTVDPSHDHRPRWSPDGRWIAFNSRRNGDDDVYIMPSQGGNSKRLTFSESDDDLCSWSPDSNFLLFVTRGNQRYPNYRMIYKIPIGGGTPQPVMDVFGSRGIYSSSKNKIAYVRNGVRWWRKGYSGSGSGSVWCFDVNTKEHSILFGINDRVASDDFLQSQTDWPLWGIDNSIYVVSEADGTFNLYKADQTIRKWTQITHFKDDGVRFPSISNDGQRIAFEMGTNIFTLTNETDLREVEIIAPLENSIKADKRMVYDDRADRVQINYSGNQLIIEVRGEIFAGWIVDKEHKAARGEANSLTMNNPARDGDFYLSPGGDSLVFVSDRNGSRNLYLIFSDEDSIPELARSRKLNIEMLTSSDEDDHSPKWSTDGKKIAFIRGKGSLFTYDLRKKEEHQLMSGWSMQQHSWSPDSRWIAFVREDNNYNSDVFIISAQGGNAVNISRHPDEDELPVWSDDGKKLGFRSRRRANNWDLYFVFLNQEDHFKANQDRAEEEFFKSLHKNDDETEGKAKKKMKDRDKEIIVTIDTLDINQRIRRVTNLSGSEGIFDISPDGESFAFTSNHEGDFDIYTADWKGKNIKRLTEDGSNPKWLEFDSKGEYVRYRTGKGTVKSVNIKSEKSKSIPFNAVLWVDPAAERMQKFDEMWRWLNDHYYDVEFHGINWTSVGKKYKTLMPLSVTEEDFADLANMMIGELNSSHSGYRSPRSEQQHKVGRLGLDFDFTDDDDGLLISQVLKNGACDRNGVHLKAGDRLLAVNGTRMTNDVNLNRILDYQVNKKVELRVARNGRQSTVLIRTLGAGAIGKIRYEEWVNGKRSTVDSLSEGRLGYLHIKGMGGGSLSRFEGELFSVGEDKEALVIDVRYNGGGWTTDFLLAMLEVKRHAVTFPRDGGPGYPQGRLPLYSWTKPIIVLCNEHSFSNAEIFSHAIKTLGRGTLVGVPTPGGVISTGWHSLLDGSGFRVPLRGWYAGADPSRRQDADMEGNGAVPDIIVNLIPGQMAKGDDVQLARAIAELLKQL